MEDEEKIKQQILNLYKIFEFKAEEASDFGMYVDHSDEENEEPQTLQEDEAILFKSHHAKFVLNNMMKLPRGMVGQDSG
jgi:prenyltransferase beta subunit